MTTEQANAGAEQGGHEAVPLLRLTGVSVQFGGIRAVDSVSFDVQAGEVVAIVGPNGAGKTTLLNAISGLADRRRAGTISLDGAPIGDRPYHLPGLGVARTFQHPPLCDSQSVLANVMAGGYSAQSYGLAAQALRTRRARRQEAELRARAETVLDQTGLSHLAGESARGLPYGTRKLVDIARALVSQPRLILMDEPTSGLDLTEQGEMRKLLIALSAAQLTIVLVEHHMDLVRAVSTKVIALYSGQMLIEGSVLEVLDSAVFTAALVGADHHDPDSGRPAPEDSA